MMGKPINITNIEEQVKEGFGNVKEHLDKVTEKVKQQDLNALQNKSRSFFEARSSFLSILFKLFIKVLGILLIVSGVFAIITTTISFFTLGIFGVSIPGIEIESLLNTTSIPLWWMTVVLLIKVIIPPLFVVFLGLRENKKYIPQQKSSYFIVCYMDYCSFTSWYSSLILKKKRMSQK